MKRTPAQQRAIDSNAPAILCLAGPGSGKSTTLAARIKRLIDDGVKPSEIVAITFTNAGARALDEKLIHPRGNPVVGKDAITGEPIKAFDDRVRYALGFSGTLHAFALRMLKRYGAGIGYGERIALIDAEAGADLLQSKATSLGCKVKLDKLLELKAKGRPSGRMDVAQTVVAGYFDELRENALVDFDTLLTEFARLLTNVVGVAVADSKRDPDSFFHLVEIRPDWLPFKYLFVDECQDSSEIDWQIYDALPIANKFFVGDSDQCQPAGTMIRMSDGSLMPIEKIKKGDQVVSYARHEKLFIKNATVSETARREFSGNLYQVSTGYSSTRCTGNHKWLIKWNRDGVKNWCTYLMRKGDYFRIGKTRFFRSGGADNQHVLGVALRMRQEGADQAWVLKVHDTEAEATAHEQITAANYGLPEACFKAAMNNVHFNQSTLDFIFSSIPGQIAKAAKVLRDHGRELEFPLFDIRHVRTRRTVQEIQACNLINDVMSIPQMLNEYESKNRAGNWESINVDFWHAQTTVYSLNVEKYHKYVADGLLTCNSIYSFRGGRLDCMLKYKDRPGVEVIALEDNFRSHDEICNAANRLISHNVDRIAKNTISARGPGGEVGKVQESLNEGSEIYATISRINAMHWEPSEIAILARTNAICAAYRDALKASGIPVAEAPKSTLPRDWALARSLVELLVDPDNDTLAFFYLVARKIHDGVEANYARSVVHAVWLESRRAGQTINGTQWGYKNPTIASVTPFLLSECISLETQMKISELVRALPSDSTLVDLALAMNVAEPEPLTKSDGVSVLTFHSVKGLEFDVVFIVGAEDEIIPGTRKSDTPADLEESRRLFYVAATRARKALYVAHAQQRKTAWGTIASHSPSRFINELIG